MQSIRCSSERAWNWEIYLLYPEIYLLDIEKEMIFFLHLSFRTLSKSGEFIEVNNL